MFSNWQVCGRAHRVGAALVAAGLVLAAGCGKMSAPQSAEHGNPDIPEFPWPPPEASARVVLPPQLVEIGRPFETLADADASLTQSLRDTGYVEASYWAIPDGFAVATKIERIERDGTPHRDRFAFSFEPSRTGPASLREYLRALFTANPGTTASS